MLADIPALIGGVWFIGFGGLMLLSEARRPTPQHLNNALIGGFLSVAGAILIWLRFIHHA